MSGKHRIISEADAQRLRKEAERLNLTRDAAAARWGIGEKRASKIMAGLPYRRENTIIARKAAKYVMPVRAGKAKLSSDQVDECIALHRNGARWAEIGEAFGISVSWLKKLATQRLGQSDGREPQTSAARMPVTRVTFATGGVLTVSHGEGPEYAEALATALCEGLKVASREVVGL
jgi:hypothetical protein